MIDRRVFLVGLGATGILVGLPGCSGDKKKGSGSGGFEALASMRRAARGSPDHLSARAAELVARKDFTGAVRFVRDNIAVVPPRNAGDDPLSAVRWGPDATLRAGAGTQRERADLLAAMLAAMGATVAVKPATRPASLDATAVLRAHVPAISLDLDAQTFLSAAQRGDLRDILARSIDPEGNELATTLAALLPSPTATDPTDGLGATIPVVEYTSGGATKWAIALGDLDEVTSAPAGLGVAQPTPFYSNISVRLLAALGDLPGVPTPPGLVELCAGTWPADQLAGCRLFVTTASSDARGTAGAPPDRIDLRTAAITVQRPTVLANTDAGWSPRLAAAPEAKQGTTITLGGARFTPPLSSGAPWEGPYGPITALDSNAHAAAVASITALQVSVSARAYPDLELTVSATNTGGAPVLGLVSSDLAITDQGARQAPALLANAAPAPIRVLLAYDCSSSVTWPTLSDKTAFDNAVADGMVNGASPTPYLVGVTSPGGSASSYVAPNASAMTSFFGSCVSLSDVWRTLGESSARDGASAVVLISDFQATDDPAQIPALQQRLRGNGVRIALVPVGPAVDAATVTTIVETCGAVVLDHTAGDFQSQLTDFVAGAAAAAAVSPYRFIYRLPTDQQSGPGTRTLRVALEGTTVSAQTDYAMPLPGARGVHGIAGLYLELSGGAGGTSIRRLSGPSLDRFGAPLTPTGADFASTRELLDGITTVAFEPGNPTAATSLDDFLTGMLSCESLFDSADVSTMLDEGKALRPYSASLGALLVAPPATAARVVPDLLRTVVMIEQGSPGFLQRRFDVVPSMNLTRAGTSDGLQAFAAAMTATAALSVREGVLLGGPSAAADLHGAALQYLAPFGNPATLTGFDAQALITWQRLFDQYADWHCLVPTDPTRNAMWVIDPRTGTTVAVGIDGSGSSCAQAAANAAFQEAIATFQTYLALAAVECEPESGKFACVGGLTASVYASVAAIFAGILVDNPPSGLDIFTLIVGTFISGILAVSKSALAGPIGLAMQLAEQCLTTVEVLQAIDDACA